MPLTQRDLGILSTAIDSIEMANQHLPKPFIGHDPERRFSFGALDGQELYFVLVMDEPQQSPCGGARGAVQAQPHALARLTCP